MLRLCGVLIVWFSQGPPSRALGPVSTWSLGMKVGNEVLGVSGVFHQVGNVIPEEQLQL